MRERDERFCAHVINGFDGKRTVLEIAMEAATKVWRAREPDAVRRLVQRKFQQPDVARAIADCFEAAFEQAGLSRADEMQL